MFSFSFVFVYLGDFTVRWEAQFVMEMCSTIFHCSMALVSSQLCKETLHPCVRPTSQYTQMLFSIKHIFYI